MRLKDVLVIGGLGALGYFGYRYQKTREQTSAAAQAATTGKTAQKTSATAAPAVEVAVITAAKSNVEPRDDADVRMRIDDGAKGTYIREMLAQDPLLVRWPERRI